MNLGNSARTMFESSVIATDTLTQNTLDSYINTANTIYSNGRSIKEK
jgi:hypothetical protein